LKNNKGIRLIQKYLYGKPAFEEKAKVEKWYEEIDESENVGNANELLQIKEQLYLRTWNKLNHRAKVIPFYKKIFFRIAAAVFVAACITSVYFLFLKNPNSVAPIAEVHVPVLRNDVTAPAVNKAMLTLADGSTIILDSAGIGSLAKQGNTIVSKLNNGKIAYNNNPNVAAKIQFNTLTVPKGSKPMQLILSDGSEVWLNVASSITYPTAFVDNERKVEITGEAYFEITSLLSSTGQSKVPFTVSAASSIAGGKNVEIQVLGTHFNVNAYNDENSLKVTLLEGSVKVAQPGGKSIYIKPGQQAELNQQGEIGLNKNIDTDEVMAWKNNWFNFNSLTVPEIMRQIEKWYGVSVSYAGKTSDKHFSGIVSRSNKVSEVLKIMEQSGIKFIIEGKKITVM
jgi:ferric-dicitrate binding protein FerR (iron transport regulator)